MNRPVQTIRAFTLIELLAVIGIIAILGVVITTSAQRISKDAKLAGATNKVLAALGEARAIAIRDRTTVLVAFTIRLKTYRVTASDPIDLIDYSVPQSTEIVFAKPTGRVLQPSTATGGSWTLIPFVVPPTEKPGNPPPVLEEFEPILGLSPILLPQGIKVAGSAADIISIDGLFTPYDDTWISQPVIYKPPVSSERGTMVVVRFAADGSFQTRNPSLPTNTRPDDEIDSLAPFIDFNRNGRMEIGTTGGGNGKFFALDEFRDESLGNHAMFLAVFDDDRFHEQATPAEVKSWQGYTTFDVWMLTGLNKKRSDFINQFSDRIHFNRFTGVAEIVPR